MNELTMNDSQFKIPPKLTAVSVILLVIGIVSAISGFASNPVRIWGNVLICNYYFICLVIGATFFAALQRITQAGWSAMFERIPGAISGYMPFAAVLTLLMVFFGSHSIYHWSPHKAGYLNFPFFSLRAVIFLGAWLFFTLLQRKFSVDEDQVGGLENFKKAEFYSRVYIFVLAPTFSLASFDWIMSIDSHWFSTIFAIINLVSAFLHGSAAIILITLILYKMGYFPKLNSAHLHDFSKYLFMLSIMWGYVWFSQYFLIWYGNIPEETIYYVSRTSHEWNATFLANVIINWCFPFLFLMNNRIAGNINALIATSVVLLVGMWLDIYMQVMPGLTGKNSFGMIELGMFLGFLGIFILAVTRSLSRANMVPTNHPYLNESFLHQAH